MGTSVQGRSPCFHSPCGYTLVLGDAICVVQVSLVKLLQLSLRQARGICTLLPPNPDTRDTCASFELVTAASWSMVVLVGLDGAGFTGMSRAEFMRVDIVVDNAVHRVAPTHTVHQTDEAWSNIHVRRLVVA